MIGAAATCELAGCVEQVPAASSAGALSVGAPSTLCTYTPSAWVDRCAAHIGPSALCSALSRARGDAQRERAALDLNVATQGALGGQHFVHGGRIALSVNDVLRLSRGGGATSDITAAVGDANRAYTDCIDHAVLADWVATPVCGLPPSFAVHGPASSRCVALDGECRRGRYDDAHACCAETDMLAGVVCDEPTVPATACEHAHHAGRDDDDGDVDCAARHWMSEFG